MAHILYKKDPNGFYTIPVQCERVNWKTCPQHKIFKDKPDKAMRYTIDFPNTNMNPASNTMSYSEYNGSDTSVAGFEFRELYDAGLNFEDIIEASSRPPSGSSQTHTWHSALIEQVEDPTITDDSIPPFVLAEALIKETASMNRKLYENLPDDNNVRARVLQEGGERYYRLATIVAENKDGVFSPAARTAAEAVQRKSNYMGGKWGTPIVKDKRTGLWEVDPDVSALAIAANESLNRISEDKKKEREKTVSYYDDRSIGYNTYEQKGSPKVRGLDTDLYSRNIVYTRSFPSRKVKKPSPNLVRLRLKKKLVEAELKEFDANAKKGFFGRRKKEQERKLILEEMSRVERELNAAENE
jgi:hypothetical protein